MGTERDLDDAIDRAVREIMSVEPRAGLRGRVLGRLERPAAQWRALPGLAAAAAVIAVALAGFLLSRPGPVEVGPEPATLATSQPAAAPADPPAASRTDRPDVAPSERSTVPAGPAARPPRGQVAAASVDDATTFSTPPAPVPRIPGPVADPIVEPIVISEIAIEQLTISQIVIAPINPPR